MKQEIDSIFKIQSRPSKPWEVNEAHHSEVMLGGEVNSKLFLFYCKHII